MSNVKLIPIELVLNPLHVKNNNVCSQYEIHGWYFSTNITWVSDVQDNKKEIIIEVLCPCHHSFANGLIKHIFIPADKNSIVYMCKVCKKPVARFSGYVTGDWKIEVNENILQ
jgi:hypothetical protein